MRQTISMGRRVRDGIRKGLLLLAAGIVCALIVFLIGYILYRGLGHISWNLISTKPSVLADNIGILPNLLNTLYVVAATLLLVLPLGVGAAIYLTEYATNRKLVAIIEFANETLAGIPSIVYGLVGMLFFTQLLGLPKSLMAGSLTLVVMTLPTIIRTTQESLKTVPANYREGSLALGAGKWRMVRTVVLPSSVDGIVTGCILAVGRIVGESAALLFTAGMAHNLYGFVEGMQSSGATLSVALYIYAKERGEFDVAFAIAAILLLLTMVINFGANQAGKRLRQGG